MLMAVDIGNTNIAIGFLEGGHITGTYRLTTQQDRTADEYGILITQLLSLSGYGRQDVEDVVVASVVPEVMHSFRASLVRFLDIEPMVVGPGIRTGMNIRLDDPRSLGADCLCDCVGAYFVYGGPVLVADFGTATTFNYVDGQAGIRSGLITVGIRSGAAVLAGKTAQLPQVEITKPGTILATGTRTAMQAGLYYNFLGGLERIVDQFRKEIGGDFKVVATGGLGSIFSDETDRIDIYDPDLMFKGMALIRERNREDRPGGLRTA